MNRCLYILMLLISFCFLQNSQAQDTIKSAKTDTIPPWTKKNVVGFDLNEMAFVNWSAGGVSSISGLFRGNFARIYAKKNINWNNELIVRYGVNKQDGVEVRKTDDAFQFNSTFGYRKDTLSHWFHSAKFNFNTQFTNGFNYPNTDLAISKPFSPAYTFLGVGAEYANKKEQINFYMSPLTLKNTLVLDQRLANQGAFGVQRAIYDNDGNIIREGENAKTELGFLFTSYFKRGIFNNVIFENRLMLYSDYINKFGNIDVDWQMQFDFIVNKYIRANLGLHLIYDDDIKAKKDIDGKQVTIGPRLQLKQMIGIGLIYEF